MLLKPLGLTLALALLAGCASDKGFHYAPPPQTLLAPEAASGWIDKQGWQGHDFMVAAANPPGKIASPTDAINMANTTLI